MTKSTADIALLARRIVKKEHMNDKEYSCHSSVVIGVLSHTVVSTVEQYKNNILMGCHRSVVTYSSQ